MKKRFVFNMMSLFSIYNLIVFYIGWHGWLFLKVVCSKPSLLLYSLSILFLSYSYFIGRSFRQFIIFRWFGSYWMAVVQYGIVVLPLADLIGMGLITAFMSTEQAILLMGSVTLTLFILIFAFGSFNAWSPVTRIYNLEMNKKGSHLSQLRIVMASDMHFGDISGSSHLQRMVKTINDLNPDIILFPGDIIDDEPGPFIRKKMGPIMKQLEAPLGVYGVLGNHEYYGGKVQEIVEELERSGVRILLDEAIVIDESFVLVGRKDRTDKSRRALDSLLTDLDASNLPLFLMDHQPFHLEQAVNYGFDLMLSGHTHRGQMAPNHLITRRMYELDWGYKQKDQLHIIVSSGYGFWGPPIRIGSRSEIVVINITFV